MKAWSGGGTILLMSVFLAGGGCMDLGLERNGDDVVAYGVQDIDRARQIIEDGGVPQVDDFEIDGLLNEHEMPLEGRQCDEPLCLNAGFGIGPVVTDGHSYGFMQIGFDSSLVGDDFVRETLNLAVVVSTSTLTNEELDAVKTALHRLLTELTPDDRLTIAVDDSSTLLVESTLVSDLDLEAVHGQINRIETGGIRDEDTTLASAYESVSSFAGAAGVNDRVMFFTDSLPVAGNGANYSFIPLVQRYAERNIGLSLFGVRMAYASGLVDALSQIRGANYFFLDTLDDVGEVFDEGLDSIVTPLAYDLYLHIALNGQLSVVDAFNMQSAEKGNGFIELQLATLFLSSGRGASLIRLNLGTSNELPQEGSLIGSAFYQYRCPESLEARESNLDLVASYSSGGYQGGSFSETGTRKAAALINEGLAMKEACRLYWEDNGNNHGTVYLEDASQMLSDEAADLPDAALLPEVELLSKLSANIQSQATN